MRPPTPPFAVHKPPPPPPPAHHPIPTLPTMVTATAARQQQRSTPPLPNRSPASYSHFRLLRVDPHDPPRTAFHHHDLANNITTFPSRGPGAPRVHSACSPPPKSPPDRAPSTNHAPPSPPVPHASALTFAVGTLVAWASAPRTQLHRIPAPPCPHALLLIRTTDTPRSYA